MNEDKKSHPIYIAVDSSKIVRCRWCGTGESAYWSQTDSGMFCSKDCRNASAADGMVIMFILIIVFFPLALFFPSGFQLDIEPLHPILFLPVLLITILASSPLLRYGLKAQSVKKRIPKGSRGDDASSAVSLLKALPSEVSCPSCDANIDIQKVSEDRVYSCEYCGATGTIEVLKSGES